MATKLRLTDGNSSANRSSAMARKTLEQRIESVKASIVNLASTLESLTHLVRTRIVKDDSESSHAQEELDHSWPDDRRPQPRGISPREAVYRGPDGALNSLGPSSALSVLAQASQDLALLKFHQASVNGRAAASSIYRTCPNTTLPTQSRKIWSGWK
ncbi:hypothetical protein MMC28_011205 [Mycoblastus sanguinarius]|nr:hypothetical protein [Mycoblastus sanguinarius]